MATSDTVNSPHLGYLADTEDSHEIARLLVQGQALTREIGDVLPEDLWSSVRQVLDIGCGPGEWALEIAGRFPHLEVTGIDISTKMIGYAQMLAMAETVPIRFLEMDATKPLGFPDQSFDLINGRMMDQFVRMEQWPMLVKECFRVLRPGGVLLLTEFELILSTSPAQERLNAIFNEANFQTGRSFSPSGRSLGITPMLSRLLKDASFEHIQQQGIVLDYSYGAPYYETWRENFVMLVETFTPFILRQQVISEAEIRHLHQQALDEMSRASFNGLGYCLAAWGVKPVERLPTGVS